MIDPDRLAAYSDGELEGEDRAALEAALVDDPQAVAQLARLRALRATAGRAFDEVLREPAPPSLVSAILAPAKLAPSVPTPSWMLVAAALLLGLFVGSAAEMFGPPLADSPEGGLRATGALAAALDRQAAGQPGPIRIGFSFRQQHGYCRTFEIARSGLAGIACRERQVWQVPVTAAKSSSGASGYTMAASETPAAILAEVDSRIVGDPLAPRAEARIRAAHWAP